MVIGEYSTSSPWLCPCTPPGRCAGTSPGLRARARGGRGGWMAPPGPRAYAEQVRAALDDDEAAVDRALDTGFATDLVVHGFAGRGPPPRLRARADRPVFASMRADLEVAEHDGASLETDIYGSAEVVGLMCLAVFMDMPGTLAAHPRPARAATDCARRLGAAFQKVNLPAEQPRRGSRPAGAHVLPRAAPSTSPGAEDRAARGPHRRPRRRRARTSPDRCARRAVAMAPRLSGAARRIERVPARTS
ncbi:squalene/phytoene synthase family protein [Kocuria rhizophila]|nr:squalene/phytoene synthase family protein [Kocuria rhizophila]